MCEENEDVHVILVDEGRKEIKEKSYLEVSTIYISRFPLYRLYMLACIRFIYVKVVKSI